MEFHPIDMYLHCVTTAPLLVRLLMIAGGTVLVLLLISCAIMLVDVVFDCGLVGHIEDPFRVVHLVTIFPIMLLFIVLRFHIQRRTKMKFYVFAFTKWERLIIERMGYGFSEHYWTVEYQNAFGARWEGADLDTTVYRRPDDVDERVKFD